MKRIKKLKGWGIYQNNPREIEEYGFKITVLHPDDVEYADICNPGDTDMEFETIENAVDWINNYSTH